MMKRFLLTIITAIAALCASAAPLAVQADSAYNRKDFKSAVRLYHQAINADGVSPEVLYNLGNAYYRIGNLGRAVIYYNRALRLDPSMTDARTNLDFVNTRILDKPEDDSTFLGNLHRDICAWTDPDAWAWTAFALFVIMLACIALYIFSGRIVLRKTGFFGGIIFLALWIYTMVIASQTASAYYSHDAAVVIVPTANMGTSPGATGNKDARIIPIHEGTKVEIIDSMSIPGDVAAPLWYDVKINNSTRAWVRAVDVERI